MKHLIETTNPSGLAIVEYDRIILNSSTNDVIVGGGVTYEYVDLGLSVKWAKCNVGAKTETDYGSYFMWGSAKANTPDECTWANAPFNGGYSEYNADVFNSVKDTACPNGILVKGYDAAAQIMGGNWRIPTDTEFQELIDNTNSVWITNYNGSGVNGRKFTASNGNSIFIPAAGYCGDGSVLNVGNYGNVWTSSLRTSDPNYAYTLFFDTSFINADDYEYYGFSYRCNGLPVRGVCE